MQRDRTPHKVCRYCGKPVLKSSWFSIAFGNCLLRALGQDCTR